MEAPYDIRILKTDPNYLKYEENYAALITAIKTKKLKCFIFRQCSSNLLRSKLEAKLVVADNSLYVYYVCLTSIGGLVMRYIEDNKITKNEMGSNVFGLLILKWIQLDIESSPSLYDILTTWTPEKIHKEITLSESFENQPPPCTDEDLYG